MIVTLEEMKNYLRVDYDDDDTLIESFIDMSEQICADIARLPVEDLTMQKTSKIAVLYAVAYLYENRENADFNELKLSLRALLSDVRKEEF